MAPIISIPHLYRVEGHGGVRVHVGPNGVERCEMDIFEGARFYEALVKGRHAREIPGIVSRVCAICSAGHTLCSLMAVEAALGIEPEPEVERFRNLLNLGQIIESHALHLFCLAVPDYLGLPGILDMTADHPDTVHAGLELKRAGNRVQEVVGGRAIHPVNMCLGGMGKRPSSAEMAELARDLTEALKMALDLQPFIQSMRDPDYGLSVPLYVALRPEGEGYGLRGSSLAALGQEDLSLEHFRQRVNEKVVSHSTAKHSLFSEQPFMVGAAARISLHGEGLKGEAARLRGDLLPRDLTALHNNKSQYIELVWCLEQALAETEDLQEGPPCSAPKLPPFSKRAWGHAALEVPRGTLFHAYELGPDGVLLDADIVTPTAQNLANIELDFGAAVTHWMEGDAPEEEELRVALERIVRAYDPCISCSTHLVDLTLDLA